jgi:hypothetical protein
VRGEGHIDSQPKSGNVKKLFSVVTYKQQELIGKKNMHYALGFAAFTKASAD